MGRKQTLAMTGLQPSAIIHFAGTSPGGNRCSGSRLRNGICPNVRNGWKADTS